MCETFTGVQRVILKHAARHTQTLIEVTSCLVTLQQTIYHSVAKGFCQQDLRSQTVVNAGASSLS